jgi:hypothetical protein
MKKALLLSILLALIFSSCQVQKINSHLQKFSQQLSTANVHLLGHLMLFSEYKSNLSTLTYNNYLILLNDNELYSTKNVSKTIQKAEQHLFIAKDSAFYIVVYSKKLKAIVFDNASTSFCDSIKVLQKDEIIPELQSFIREEK